MQHHAKKRFGQNFLVDENIIQRIVDSINPQTQDCLIEIGPGLGAITVPLLQRVDRLDVIELDRDIIPRLLSNCRNSAAPVIHEMDVLKFNFTEFSKACPNPGGLRIVGNLPYNISTAVLFVLLKSRHVIKDMHFMLQKEVVERISAQPGSRIYGRLSVMIQTYFRTTPLFLVPAHAFKPAPKVESAIIRLLPDEQYSSKIQDHDTYEKLVRCAFAQRRKTLKNNLAELCTVEQILAAGIDPAQRAETLSIGDFLNLYRQIT